MALPSSTLPGSFERAVVDPLPPTIYTTDLTGRITSANRSWSRAATGNGGPALGDEERALDRSIFDAIADGAARDQIEHAMSLLRAGRVPIVAWELTNVPPDAERVGLVHAAPLHDDAHAVTGFVFATVDITATHRSREALIDTGIALSRAIDAERLHRELAAHVRRAVRGAAFCLATDEHALGDAAFAADGDAALRVVHAVGYDADAGALAARLAPTWRAALASGRVSIARSAAGVELTAPLVSASGVRAAMTVLSDDVDRPDRLDEATRALETIAAQASAAIERAAVARRLEHRRRLEAVGEVSAGVAHELRNPLFGISSAAQLLRFRVKDDPVVEKNVGRILREVDRLNRMVTGLLDYGRPSASTLAPGDPDAVWDEVLDAQRGLLESKSLVVQRERAAAAATCAIDADQLGQLFLHVLANAVDAAPEGSDLSLVSTTLPHGAWRCRLRDGGAPVPADVLARAFEIFYSTKPGGTGMGLALGRRIVDAHGGAIALDSDAASGTVCTITLPPS